jgi:hypothetical protein
MVPFSGILDSLGREAYRLHTMPAALPEHTKNLVRAYLLQGLKPQLVSLKTGVNYNTVNTIRNRSGLKQALVQVTGELRKAADSIDSTASDEVAQASASVRTSLSKGLRDASEVVERIKTPAKSLKAAKAKLDAVQVAVNAADRLFGWSDTQSQTLVSVNILQQLSEPGALDYQAAQPAQAAIMDVEALPVADQPATDQAAAIGQAAINGQ